tara:strand:+ start:4407 stop:4904 length:498 start_codon:yes stop_codon:yes gene_type:complete
MSIHFHDSSVIHTASGLGQNAGDILQTVGPDILSSNFTTSNSSNFQDSGIAKSITPSSTSSKILIIACLDCMGYGDRDRRPNTGIFYGTVSGTPLAQQVAGEYHTGDSGSYSYGGHTYWFLHSPSTTSQITYRVGLKSLDGSNVRIHGASSPETRSYLYLQEVKG